MICMRASDLPAAAPHTASQHPTSLSAREGHWPHPLRYGPAMTPDYTPSLLRSFERHLRAENRSDNTIESYLESIGQAEAFLAGRGRTLPT
jgi:hypothetical protein